MGQLRKTNAPFEQGEYFESFEGLGWQIIVL